MGVFHRKDNRFVVLKSQPVLDPEDFKSFVNYELNTPFRSVKVIICNPFSCLYPEPLFDKTRTRELYTFNHAFQPQAEELLTDRVPNLGAVNIYKISILLRELLNSYFPQYQVMHYATPILQGLFSEHQERPEADLFINDDFIHLIVREGRTLKLINSFDFEAHEDILYYVLAVFEQLGLNLRTHVLRLHGDCVRFVELYELLRKYIMEVQLAERPLNIAFDPALDQIPEHLFYPLFAAPLCES